MKLWGAMLACGLVLFSGGLSAAVDSPLARLDYHVVGIGLEAGPEYQAVPKGIQTLVSASIDAQGFDADLIGSQLPKDYRVKAELSGPAFLTPKTLETLPGKPFDIPTLALLGKHTLNNIRLVDGSGKTLFGAVPQAVVIESINDPLITEVKTRQLTLEEIQERGVVFDSSNFSAYEFTAAIATESGQVPLSLPVLIPDPPKIVNDQDLPSIPPVGIPTPPVQYLPPRIEKVELPPNLTVSPFVVQVDENEDLPEEIVLPPIPGIIVIPGNIGFLHQYFSALALVTNGAPLQSNLVIRDVQAKIVLPDGEDRTPGNDAAPGDDPLRMAKGAAGFFPRTMQVLHAGADGKSGTADDVSRLAPGQTGQADFTIEGLKEGTHKLEFEITATLDGLPIGPVQLTGRAVGAVLVRNPEFSVTMSHPATVRAGEEYDLFITVTNTGKALANLVSLHLDPRALSGATFADGETADKQLATIAPGSSETARFRLTAQRSGAVTATVFVSEDVKGRINLRTGVGEKGIPLSPDSLILPHTGSLPQDLTDAAVGLLGQAWSIATAPAGALPADVSRIAKQTVADRAYDLSEAGLRILIGDAPVKAVEDLTFDFFGSDKAVKGFDELRRFSTQGLKLNRAIAAVFDEEAAALGPFSFQAELADKVSYRPGHLSVVTSPAPVRVLLSDAAGNRTGGLSTGENHREIPYADRLILGETASSRGSLVLVTALNSLAYRLELQADEDALFDLGIVLPDASGTLRQLRFRGVHLPAGARAAVLLNPGSGQQVLLTVDADRNGQADATLTSSDELAIPDRAPRIVAATQIVPGFGLGGDKHGRNVAVLFSETVTSESARDVINYRVDENEVKNVNLQAGGRMAFFLLRDGIGPFFDRSLTAGSLVDLAGNAMTSAETVPIRITAQGPAAVVGGVVREANGAPVPGAVVRLMQEIWYDDGISIERRWAIFSEKKADADGAYRFDYVLRNDDPAGPFRIEAVHPQRGEAGLATTGVAYHGQQILLDIFMKARGSLSGIIFNEAGNPVGGATVQVSTLNDGRRYNARTDAAGSYALANISVGPFRLEAIHTGSMAQGIIMGTLSEDGSALVQDLTIYPAQGIAKGSIGGTVLDADGLTPRLGVVVIVRGDNYENWMRSGADGGFAFDGVYAGAVSVEAWDYATGEGIKVSGSVGDGVHSVFTVILPGVGTVTGQVQRADGGSVEDLCVIAEYGKNGQHKQLLRTDSQGSFLLEGLPVGKIALKVLDPNDFNRQIASATVHLFSSGETVTVPLFVAEKALATGAIRGTVYKRDGSSWPFADIRLADLSTMTYIPYKADASGKYFIANASLKTHNLVVVQGSEIINATTNLWYGGQERELDLRPAVIGSVTGTVWDDVEKTMPAGADVRLISMKPDAMGWLRYDTNKPTIVKSDPLTGRFTINGVYAGSFSVQTSNVFRPIPVSASGSITSAKPVVDVTLVLQGSAVQDSDPGTGGVGDSGSQPPPEPVNAMGSISGQVLWPDGTPAGEGVRLTTTIGGGDVTVTTDKDGLFQFRPILPYGNRSVIAFDPVTTLTWRGSVYVPRAEDVAITARLLGRGSLVVRTLNADGTPEPGTVVSVKGTAFPNDSASGVSDVDGMVTFANLNEGKYAVSASGSYGRGGKAEGVIAKDGAAMQVSVTLASSGTVVGTFFKADGKTPIAGGQILLKRSGKTAGFATTSADPENLGRYIVEHVPLGGFTVEGFDPTTERTGAGGGTLSTNGQTVTANVTVGARGTVEGVVLNYSGTAPISKAKVDIGAKNYSYTTTTGTDGTFIFAGVPAGTFNLTAMDPTNGLTGKTSGTISFEGESAQAEVRIAPTGMIEGRVVLPDGITPATNATVSFQGKNVQVDGTSGGFFFTHLAAGASYSIGAAENNTNRAGSAVAVIREDGEKAFAEIVLRGIGAVAGTVFESDGITPLAGAQVQLQGGGLTCTGVTDFDGYYRFENIPQGSFSLKASHPQRATAAAVSGQINGDGQIVTVHLTIGPIASVTGTVFLWDGVTPAAGGGVKFTSGTKSFTTVIDSAGTFLFGGIPIPGNFSLYMEDANGIGIGKAAGSLTVNGEIFDVGTIVLDEKPIAVVEIDPSPGSINIANDRPVRIVFSEAADPTTVNGNTVYVTRGATRLAGTLTLDADQAGVTFTSNSPWAGMALHQVVVTTGLKDRVGRTLPSTYTSTFTTLDNVSPTVKSVSPTAGQIEVALDVVIRVTFSEPIDPAHTEGVVLKEGSVPVPVRLDLVSGNTVAILTPLSPLKSNAFYTVAVAGVRDAVGNIQTVAANTTFATIDSIPPTLTALTVSASAALVVGNTVPVTATVADSDVALVDLFADDVRVATDSSAPFVFNLLLPQEGTLWLKAIAQDKVGNRGGAKLLQLEVVADQPPTVAILSPSEVAIVDTGTAFSVQVQGVDDVLVKDITLTAAGEMTFNQSKGTGTGKIFTTTFSPTVPVGANPGNAIVLTAAARDSGGKFSPLVQRTVYVRDATAPQVSLASPGQSVRYKPGEVGTATVTAADNHTLTEISCTVSGAATGGEMWIIDPQVKEAGRSLEFQVKDGAAPHASIQLVCTARDAFGNTGNRNFTLQVADIVPPRVTGSNLAGAWGVPVDSLLTVTFDESLDPATVDGNSVILARESGGQLITGVVALSVDKRTITLRPVALEYETAYVLTISGSVADHAGNTLGADHVVTFTAVPENTAVIQNLGTANAPYVLAGGWYQSISISNSYVVFDGPVGAGRVALENGSVVTQKQTGSSMTGRVDVTAEEVFIDATSRIDVSGRGYLGGAQPGNANDRGRTLGDVTTDGSYRYSGGSYGGYGGQTGSDSVRAPYGNPADPNEFGSGGGGSVSAGWRGGNGGGLVRLSAAELILEGSILADGMPGSTAGSGSGGGIRLDVGTLSGNGKILARGGANSGSNSASGGGGGRVAVYYDNMIFFGGQISSAGGKSSTGYYTERNGGAGTVYLKDNAAIAASLHIENDGVLTSRATPVADVNLSKVKLNSGALSLGGALSVTGELLVTGNNNTLTIAGGDVIFNDVSLVGGQLELSGKLTLSGILSLQSNSTLTGRKIEITAGKMQLDPTSRIDVSGRGYLGGAQPGNANDRGRTLGDVTTDGSYRYSGGSYGGYGGQTGSDSVRAPYGNPADPNEFGSGGGGSVSAGWRGGNGGGLVRLSAAELILEGSILADGMPGSTAGSGSGGGIRLDVGTLSGNGKILARGGANSGSNSASGGGGGRVAVYYDNMIFFGGQISSAGGKSSTGYYTERNGGAGTIYLKNNEGAFYGDLILNNGGTSTSRKTPIPGGSYENVQVTGGAVLENTGDSQPPAIMSVRPANGAIAIPLTTDIIITFDEPIDPMSVTAGILSLSTDGTNVPGRLTLSADRKILTCQPEDALDLDRSYTVTLSPGIADMWGNRTTSEYRSTFSTRRPGPDLVGFWPLDSSWNDLSGNGYNLLPGIDSGFSPDVLAGNGSASVAFDGVDSYAFLPNLFEWPPAEMSLSVWVKPSVGYLDVRQTILAHGDGGQFALAWNAGTRRFDFTFWTAESQWQTVPSANVFDPDVWHHVAAVYVGSESVRLYVDGQLEATSIPSFSMGNLGPHFIFSIGAIPETPPIYRFSGQLDNVFIYRRALWEEEVREHYFAGLTVDRKPPATPEINSTLSPTHEPQLHLSGTKEADTSVWINGRPAVTRDVNAWWDVELTLEPGENILEIVSRDKAGNQSARVSIRIELNSE